MNAEFFTVSDHNNAIVSHKTPFRLHIAHQVFIETDKMPNGWHRFWQRILLGWTWEQDATVGRRQ